jgi:hypothetical protein
MQPQALQALENELNMAQTTLDLHIRDLPDGDARVARAQQAIDSVWALFNRANKNHGSVTPEDFAPLLEQMRAELTQVAQHA